ncbi:MAG: ABC transporter permease [Clostridia bacterium]
MSAYYYVAKMKLMVFLTYRFEVFTSLGTNLIIIVANMFLWKTAYRGIDSVAGVNESQMLTYAMMSIILASFYSGNVENTIQDRITRGDIAIDLFRPVNLLLCYLAEDVGIAVSSVISKLIPLLIIMAVFIQAPIVASPGAFILFLLSTFLSFMISWLISALIGLLCFWVLQLGEIKTIKDGIILLLSGKIIPLWLFPKGVQKVLEFLPFHYIYQTPLSIYIGKLPPEKIVSSMSIQLVWVMLFTALLCFGWSRARKRVLIQGG